MKQNVSRRSFLGGLGVAAAGLAFEGLATGCSSEGQSHASSGGSGQGSTGSDGQGSGADGGQKLDFTSYYAGEDVYKAAMEKMASRFEKANTGVQVGLTGIPYNKYLDQVLLRLRGGNLTGAVQIDIAWLATFAATQKLVDLGKYAKGVDYTKAASSLGIVDGTQYGLPFTNAGIGLVANQDILDQAGVGKLPETVDEFEQALTAIKKLGNGIIPYAAMTAQAQLKDIIPWMWTWGSKVVDGEDVTIGDPESVAATEWYKGLLDKGLTRPGMDRFDARSQFARGKVGFYEDAIGAKATVSKMSDDKKLGSKVVPVKRPVLHSGDTARGLAWGSVICVPEGDQAEMAAKFAKAITSDTDYSIPWAKSTQLPPTTKSGLADSSITGNEYLTEFVERIGQFTSKGPFWPFDKSGQMEVDLGKSVEAVLAGSTSAKDALSSAQKKIKGLM